MINYLPVKNKINKISSKSVTFDRPSGEIEISRVWSEIVLWKLLKDGIYVRSEAIKNHKLNE